MLQNFFNATSDRIQTLWLDSGRFYLDGSIFAGVYFPSLKSISYHAEDTQIGSITALLPSFVASDHLETFKCQPWNCSPDMVDQMSVIFSRVRKLHLVLSKEDLRSVLVSFQNNSKLHTLHGIHTFWSIYEPLFLVSGQTTFPELRVLCTSEISVLGAIRAPKLLTLDISCCLTPIAHDLTPKDFDFSSIQCLCISDRGYSGERIILGFTQPLEKVYPTQVPDFGDIPKLGDIDILSGAPLPHYFRLVVHRTLGEALFMTLPQLVGLLELRLSFHLVKGAAGGFDEILEYVPSLEKLIIHDKHHHHAGLKETIRTISNTSLSPCLTHLSYIAPFTDFGWVNECKNLTTDIGELLTECVRLRREVHGSKLQYIVLAQCSPLPDSWLMELEQLDTTVVTGKNVQY